MGATRAQASSLPISQTVLDDAINKGLLTLANQQTASSNGNSGGQIDSSQKLVTLAVVAYQESGTTRGTNAGNRLVLQLRNIVKGAQGGTTSSEPSCLGGLLGWADSQVAAAILLAKNTPAVWNQFSADERSRMDWLMRSLAIVGHFQHDDDNNYGREADGNINFRKTFNSNITDGYVFCVIYASLYFGASQLNAIFTSYDFDTYIAQFDTFGWKNVKKAWTTVDAANKRWDVAGEFKRLTMNGGTVGAGSKPGFDGSGDGLGVRNTFTYRGVPLSDPIGLYQETADRMYGLRVVSRVDVPDQAEDCFIADTPVKPFTGNNNVISPYQGQMGMCWELGNIGMGGGFRSDVRYSYDGWHMHMVARAVLQLMGQWNAGASVESDLDRRIFVGSEDLLFKLDKGYRGRANGTYRDHFTADTIGLGYNDTLELWRKTILGVTSTPTPPAPPAPITTSLEAENATLTAPMAASSDSTASGGQFVQVPAGTGKKFEPDINAAKAVFNINVPITDNYTLWGLVQTSNGSDSFFVTPHNSTTLPSWLGAPNQLWVIPVSGTNWAWHKFPNPIWVRAGGDTLAVQWREDGTRLDKIMLSNEPNFVPAGRRLEGGTWPLLTATSTTNNTRAPLTVDGKKTGSSACWYAQYPANNDTLTIDAGNAVSARGVGIEIYANANTTYRFDVDYSTDGSNWTPWLSNCIINTTVKDVFYWDFPGTPTPNARYFRLTNRTAWLFVSEIRLYGNDQVQNSLPSPVAWWKLNNNALDSAGTNNGTLLGAPVFSTDRVEGSQALTFDGVDDRMTAPDSTSLRITGDLTIALSAKIPSDSGGVLRTLLSKSEPSGYKLQIRDNNMPLLLLGNGTNLPTYIYATAAVPLGSWQHLAVTVDFTGSSGVAKFYLNGTQLGNSVNVPLSSIQGGTGDMVLGRRVSGNPHYGFRGSLDNVRIFNSALSANEVAALD